MSKLLTSKKNKILEKLEKSEKSEKLKKLKIYGKNREDKKKSMIDWSMLKVGREVELELKIKSYKWVGHKKF